MHHHTPDNTSQQRLFFTLYLGSPNNKQRLDEHDRVSAIHKIMQKFDTFTLTEGKGMWDGQFEDTLLIHIVTNDTRSVAELALPLRSTFNQDGVGIQFGFHYIRAHRGSYLASVLESIQRVHPPSLKTQSPASHDHVPTQ